MDLQKPTVGRIVHYTTQKGNVRAALIVSTWGDSPTAAVNLRVFTDFTNDANTWEADKLDPELAAGAQSGVVWITSKCQSGDGQPKPGHWHFPPRA
ncbi:MAG TPA: hypothetical protein VFV10_04585 [Gammaproteobacteria bacterium]|nr:hypothetical protein [Gammaproteobacteria bacterium]